MPKNNLTKTDGWKANVAN